MRTPVAVVCLCLVFASLAAAQKPTPRKVPPTRPPAATPPKQQSKPVPEPPEPPVVMLLDPQQHNFVVGDKWTYQVFSPDTLLDGRTIEITLTAKDAAKATFHARLDTAVARSSEVALKDLTWFRPDEKEPGQFVVLSVGELYPKRAERGVNWNTSKRNFQYDRAGNRTGETGYQVFGSPPMTCVARTGTYPCVSTMLFPLNAAFTYDVYFTPDIPAVLAAQVKRARDADGYMVFELVGFDAGGVRATATSPNLPAIHRNLAVNWMKSHTKFGSGSLVANFIYLLQEGARRYPGGTLEFSVGSDLTNDGNAYVLQWRNGKFVSRPMTTAERAASDPQQLKRQLIR